LTPTYQKAGTTGSAAVDTLVKAHLEAVRTGELHWKTVEEQKNKIDDLSGASKLATEAQEAATKAAKEYADFLNTLGVYSQEQYKEELIKVTNAEADVTLAYQNGKLTGEQYAAAINILTDEAAKYGITINTNVLPPGRDLSNLMANMPAKFQDTTYKSMEFNAVLDRMADDLGVSAATTRTLIYEIARLQLAFAGIVLPDIRIPTETVSQMKTDTDTFKGYWDGLFVDITKGWADTIKDFGKGNTSLVTTWNRLWKDLGDTVLTFISKILVEKFLKAIQGIVSPAKNATDAVGQSFTGIGTAVGNAAISIGTAIKNIVTGIMDAVKAIADTVIDIVAYAITTLADAIATAINSLATAAPALLELGLVAAAIYTAFKLGESLVGAIGNIIGGGSDTSPITDWLKVIYDTIIEYGIALGGHLIFISDKLVEMFPKIDNLAACFVTLDNVIKDNLDIVADRIVAAIGNIPGAAAGALVMGPALVNVGENAPGVPEVILPLPELGAFARNMAAAGAGASGGAGAGGGQQVFVFKPIIIDKGDKWMIRFVQENLNHGAIRVPISGVGG